MLNNIGSSRVILLEGLSLAVKHSPFSWIFLACCTVSSHRYMQLIFSPWCGCSVQKPSASKWNFLKETCSGINSVVVTRVGTLFQLFQDWEEIFPFDFFFQIPETS